MANRLNINVYKNPPVKTKYFPAFDGVDFVSPYTSISEKHSPNMVNMFRDYTENGGGRLRTRPFTELVDVSVYPYNKGQYPIVYNNKLLVRSGVSLKDYSAKQFDKNNIVFTRNSGTNYVVTKYVSGDFYYYFEHIGGKGKLNIKDVDGTEKTVFTFGTDTKYKSYTGKWLMMGGTAATFTFTGDVTSGDETYSIRSLVVNDKYVKEVAPATVLDTFVNEQPSDKMHVEYGNKLYFYEKNSNNMGDVYVYNGSNISRFSNILTSYEYSFENTGYYNDSAITFPYVYGSSTERYKPSDYTNFDAMNALQHQTEGKVLTAEQMQKYDLDKSGDVEQSDAMKLFQIAAGKYKDVKHYYTQDDLDYVSHLTSPEADDIAKYDINKNGTIDADDINSIRIYVSKGSYDIKSIPVEIAPVTYINANKDGAGSAYERINLLSPYFINQFISDGTSTEYKLSSETAIPLKWQLSNSDTPSTFVKTQAKPGKVVFDTDEKPTSNAAFYVLCKMSNAEYEMNSRIVANMSIAQIFDNRVFLAGNPEYPNRLIHSIIDNLLYFPDNAFYEDIMGSGDITALLPVKTQLAVIKSDISGQTAIYLHTPTDTNNELSPKKYPSAYGMFDKGCVNNKCYANFNGEAVFLSKDGLMAISSLNLSDERSIQPRSTVINSMLCNYDLSKARMTVWQNYLVIAIENKMFLADGNKRVHNPDTQAYEYEWYYWDNLGVGHLYSNGYIYGGEILSLVAIDNVLYYTLRDEANVVTVQIDGNIRDNRYYRDFTAVGENENPVPLPVYSCVTTPYTSFGYPQYYKSCVRRGNVATISGANIKAYAYTDVAQYANIIKNANYSSDELPYFSLDKDIEELECVHNNNVLILRPFKKRWLNISFMFYSEEPMAFYDATIQAQINNTVNNI